MLCLSGQDGPSDGGGEAQDLERSEPFDLRGRSRTRVGDPDVSETGVEKLLPGALFEHAVGGIGAHFSRASFLEGLEAFDRGATGVDEIVDDDDLPSGDLAFTHRDFPLVSIPDLPADDEGVERRAVFLREHRLEPLPGAFVREGDGDVLAREPLLEELRARLELGRDVLTEVVPNRECVDVPEVERHRSRARRRDRRDHLGERTCCRHLSFMIDPLHRSCGEVGEEDLEGLGSEGCERVDQAHLFEDRVRTVETHEERNVGVLYRLDAMDEQVGHAVREAFPADRPHRDPRIMRHDFGRDRLHLRTREQDVRVHGNLSSVVERPSVWPEHSEPQEQSDIDPGYC